MSIYHYQGGDILRLCSYQTISEWSLPETGSDQVNYSNKDTVVVSRSPPSNVVPVRSRPGAICRLSLLLVLALLREFFSGFYPLQKLTLQILIRPGWEPERKPAKTDVTSSINVEIYLPFYNCSGNGQRRTCNLKVSFRLVIININYSRRESWLNSFSLCAVATLVW